MKVLNLATRLNINVKVLTTIDTLTIDIDRWSPLLEHSEAPTVIKY